MRLEEQVRECDEFFQEQLAKVGDIVQSRYPEALRADVSPHEWARTVPGLAPQMKTIDAYILGDTATSLCANGLVKEFRTATLEWGRAELAVHREFATHLRTREAA